MTDLNLIFLAAVAGFILGGLYFGGLWLTIRHLPDSRHPALLMLGSFMLRSFFVAAGFYPMIQQDWHNALFMLIGFILARLLLTRYVKPSVSGSPSC